MIDSFCESTFFRQIHVSRAGAALNRYQVHCRFILLDTVIGYRSQYHKESFLIECV